MAQIRISEETMARLKALAEPFIDKEPEDVVRRLLDRLEHTTKPSVQVPQPSRMPRERGVTIQMGNRKIQAISVRDLYAQALRVLVDEHRSSLKRLLPFKTSSERYLIAEKPIHPTGNAFVVPVEYQQHYMEAHKDYKNAVKHLELLARGLGLKVIYLS